MASLTNSALTSFCVYQKQLCPCLALPHRRQPQPRGVRVCALPIPHRRTPFLAPNPPCRPLRRPLWFGRPAARTVPGFIPVPGGADILKAVVAAVVECITRPSNCSMNEGCPVERHHHQLYMTPLIAHVNTCWCAPKKKKAEREKWATPVLLHHTHTPLLRCEGHAVRESEPLAQCRQLVMASPDLSPETAARRTFSAPLFAF